MRRTPVLIVGGGPAGSAAALTLCKRGIRPEILERTCGPHDVVCGGFLSWSALRALRRLGIDVGALGARPIHRARLIGDGRTAEFRLPHAAAGLSRRRLDAALLEATEAVGAVVRRGRAVRSADAEQRLVRMDDGEEIAAQALILATGKHELRGVARRPGRPRAQTAIGLRTAVPVTARGVRALAGTVELHLFNEGYAGLLLQEDGMANLCLSVSQRRVAESGGVPRLVDELAREAPQLLDHLRASPPTKWDAVAGVPYGWRASGTAPGVFRTGDQAAVIASLVGDGLAIALSSGAAAGEALAGLGPDAAPRWQARFARSQNFSLALAETIRAAAEAQLSRRLMLPVLRAAPSFASTAARLTRTSR